MTEKYQYYNGVKFTRDEKTGYYLNSTLRIRMHRFVWLCEKGDIPKGYDVHHIDHDRSNNNISNLELLTKSEHRKTHYEEMSDEKKQERLEIMDRARESAIDWHKSEEGKRWHSEMVKQAWEDGRLGKKTKFVCEVCGKHFEQVYKPGHKFCSGACSQKFLRNNQPLQNRVCEVCGKIYTCKVTSLSHSCSKSCANVIRAKNIKHRKDTNNE